MAGENIKVTIPFIQFKWDLNPPRYGTYNLIEHYKEKGESVETFVKPHHLQRIRDGYTLLERIRDWLR
jgi:hypothetical protein